MKRVSSFCQSALSRHPVFSQFSQLSQHLDDKKPYVYFVIPPGETKESCTNLNLGEMFVVAEAHFLNVMWINDEDCKDQELQDDGNVFVFDPFGSPGFQYMMELLSGSPRVEILGPTVLRQVFNDPQQNTFETKECPIYTLAMKGMIICLSGFKEKAKKEELETMVRWMNGALTPSLTKAVTHVVTASAITPKCIEANKEQIPVMTEEWLRDVWKDNQISPVAASDERYIKYLCPAFYNVNICMSQITAVKKNTLKSGIEKQGGKCSSELTRKQTDVLVVPNPSGDKFKYALKWNVKCVTPQWVENSIEKGHILPLEEYKVGVDAQGFVIPTLGPITSTPAHSMINDWNMTRMSAIMDDDNRQVVEASNAHYTRTSAEVHEDTMSQLRAADNKAFLDGCKIYLVEYEKCDELKRELNKSGAVRMDQLCKGVTHVIVVGHKLPKAIQDKINELDSTPYVVTVEWVLQSAKDGSPADEDMFKFEPQNTICQETFNAPPDLNVSSHVGRVSASALESHPQDISNVVAGKTLTKSDQTATTSKSTSRSNSSKSNTNSTETNPTSSKTDTRKKANSDTTTKDTSAESKSSSTTTSDTTVSEDSDSTEDGITENENGNAADPSSPGVFVGITLKVVMSDDEERKYLEQVISENGGRLVQDNADVAILSPICSSFEKDRADKSYTKYWLFECLDYGALDVPNVFHYIPLPSFERMDEVLRGVVLAISQYPAIEREYLIEVVKALGARYQDVFARKNSNDGTNLRSTHLICKNMDTDKAKAAKKWNVPVVVAEWLLDSFNERKQLQEEKYDPCMVNTSDERTVFMPTPQRRRQSLHANAHANNNMSARSVYPPSTQKKGGANTLFRKTKGNEAGNAKTKERTPPLKDQPTVAKPESTNNGFRTPTSVSKKPHTAAVAIPSSSKNALNKPAEIITNAEDDSEEDSFLKTLPRCPPQEEIDRKMAEYKAIFPYSDDSYNRMLEDIQARGIDLDAVSPFTSFEERRLCNPDPDSPILLGLPRHESRALKEQFEIALNRTPNIPKLKVKTPTSTPLSEIVRRFNAMSKQDADPQCLSPPGVTSTPKDDLRRRATLNRLSQGNLNISNISAEGEDDQPMDTFPPIRKLANNKRPSDGSPEEEEPKSSKRARKSSDEDSDNGEIIPRKSGSPNENNVPKQTEGTKVSNENPPSSTKPNHMQHLTNLVAAENKLNPTIDTTGGSPIKRRSDDVMLVPCDEVNDEIERPHLSWVDDEEQNQKEKMSTVKKVVTKPRIASEPDVSIPAEEQKAQENGRKRSSRLRKTPSVVGTDEIGGGRVTRQTRNRSSSKSRKEDAAPLGHQPIKISDGKKSKKRKPLSFPIDLPENPIFGLSSLDPREKMEAMKIIKSLGGTTSKESNFDINCNALITSKLLRSEKVLGCIASGKYILKPGYLTKSEEAGRFLAIDEEFLWHESNINENKERELARASYGWLKAQMEDKDKRPMIGVKFFIMDQTSDKAKAFERLIEAGGGEIVTKIKDATCVVKDEKSTTSVPEGINVVNPLHLNTLILSAP